MDKIKKNVVLISIFVGIVAIALIVFGITLLAIKCKKDKQLIKTVERTLENIPKDINTYEDNESTNANSSESDDNNAIETGLREKGKFERLKSLEQEIEKQRINELNLLKQEIDKQRINEHDLLKQETEKQRINELNLLKQEIEKQKINELNLLKQEIEKQRINEVNLLKQEILEQKLEEQKLINQKLIENFLDYVENNTKGLGFEEIFKEHQKYIKLINELKNKEADRITRLNELYEEIKVKPDKTKEDELRKEIEKIKAEKIKEDCVIQEMQKLDDEMKSVLVDFENFIEKMDKINDMSSEMNIN